MGTGTSNEADLASAAESWRWWDSDLPPSRPRLLRFGLTSPASALTTSAAQALASAIVGSSFPELRANQLAIRHAALTGVGRQVPADLVKVDVNLEREQGCNNAGVACCLTFALIANSCRSAPRRPDCIPRSARKSRLPTTCPECIYAVKCPSHGSRDCPFSESMTKIGCIYVPSTDMFIAVRYKYERSSPRDLTRTLQRQGARLRLWYKERADVGEISRTRLCAKARHFHLCPVAIHCLPSKQAFLDMAYIETSRSPQRRALASIR